MTTPESSSSAVNVWVTLAHLLRPQGRKGELLAELYSDFPDRFAARPTVYLAPPSFTGSTESARKALVISHWLPSGKNQGRIVLHFEGISSITEAEQLAGLDVIVPAEDRVPLGENEHYVDDLVGCMVFDREAEIGVVEEVQFATSSDGSQRRSESAPTLAVLTPEGDQVLIPYVTAFLDFVDCGKRRIQMTLPAGLLEINRPQKR